MFFKNVEGLKRIPLSSKLGLTAFLLIAGIGYLFGFLNIYLTYSPVDRQPGLSLEDISLSFYGARETTKLEKAIDGTMKDYFESDNDYNAVKEWIQSGADGSTFELVQKIFDSSCTTCHSKESEVAGIVTANYDDVKELLIQDTGKSPVRLVSLSHTHILATLAIIFALALVFSFTSFKEIWKIIVIVGSFLSIVLDVGSWWLAKLSPAFSILVIAGGVSLALSFLVLILLSLYDIWLKKEKAGA
ncbi:MAG: hypothetical protein JW969_12150 [Spirochaetales bacterium]|nr:hypothetical protein [Spirochaetales bacterium]